MTFSIKIADANFSNYVSEAIPHAELAEMFLLFGGDAAASTRNYVGNKLPASVVGSPIYAKSYCTLSEANGFEGALSETGSPFTHVIVATRASANSGYCGNWVAGKAANMLNRNGTDLNIAIDGNFRVSTPMSDNGFQFIAGSHDGSTAKVFLGNGGSLNINSVPYSGGGVTKAKFRAGANNYSAGQFNAAAVLTFDSALTNQQITDVYNYLRKLLAMRDIIVA